MQRIEPRSKVTPADLDAEVARGKTVFTRIEGTTITHCAIVLANGFSVTGESACVDPANFDQKMGEEIAFKNAREKLWPLLGFRLADERTRSTAYIVEQGALTDADFEALTNSGLVIATPAPAVTDEMVSRFLTWKLPKTVCPDAVASDRSSPYRSGTNLLTATEARQMLEHVLGARRGGAIAGPSATLGG